MGDSGNTAQIDREIKKQRRAEVELILTGSDGSPLARQDVTLEQTRHKFLFGVAGFDIISAATEPDGAKKELAGRRVDKLTALFNFVDFAVLLGPLRALRGRPDTARIMQAARWCADHHILVKGHPLCWHTLSPDWLLPLTNAEILQAQLRRIRREVTLIFRN